MTPFEVLPHGGLDQSILIPVLVGVYVALFFTETFGWVFVGLVVPGYLASVLALQPTTAAVIVLEAIVTYLLARGLAYALAPTGVWAPFFGRDRFFVIVLASVLVRQHDQLWILPALSSWLELQMGTELPPVREFYSIGLVLVPLTANMLWKPGLWRGLGPLAVVVGLTYATLELVLLPLTNLSLSSFELLYEDSAIDFLGHARAYVLLLTTATLAARFNLRFGWDFGGILVPALLGLLWFTPLEMMVTLAEACILWSITKLLLRYTPLKRYNLEGPRKLALVFTLSVALKWMLSLIVSVTMPGMRARELFGFGYLLSTLLAIRMLPKKATRRVLLPTITTAFAGWLIGSALGLGLDVAAPVPTPVPAFNPRNTSDRLLRSEAGALALGHVRAELAPPRLEAPPASALIAHAEAWSALAAWIAAPTDDAAATARDAAARADLGIHAMSAPTGLFHHVSYAISPIERGVVHTSWPSASGGARRERTGDRGPAAGRRGPGRRGRRPAVRRAVVPPGAGRRARSGARRDRHDLLRRAGAPRPRRRGRAARRLRRPARAPARPPRGGRADRPARAAAGHPARRRRPAADGPRRGRPAAAARRPVGRGPPRRRAHAPRDDARQPAAGRPRDPQRPRADAVAGRAGASVERAAGQRPGRAVGRRADLPRAPRRRAADPRLHRGPRARGPLRPPGRRRGVAAARLRLAPALPRARGRR
ncbi:poly-gamma-glutamate biosynthesis protein PgsC/CapC [Nannocystis pusilla]|uniref:poly-gamma-glutamate biosynthesis protein PgsC/CapC n=1 Tax=Nannocystis pusilla TaxID=889268 RepID=UPI003DA1E62F